MSEVKVSEVVQGINDELAVMADAIERLEKSLEAILSPAPPGDAGVIPEDVSVELVTDLTSVRNAITSRTERLGSIMDRIAL